AWQERAVRRPRSPAANREKDVVGVAQVGAGIFDGATELLGRRALAIEDLAHAGVDRQVAEGQAPGDAHAAEVTIERLRERGRIRWIAARVARVCASHDTQKKCGVFGGTGHRTL